MITIGNGVGVAIAVWKLGKAVKFERFGRRRLFGVVPWFAVPRVRDAAAGGVLRAVLAGVREAQVVVLVGDQLAGRGGVRVWVHHDAAADLHQLQAQVGGAHADEGDDVQDAQHGD
ncbi:hypothetical protein FGB62_2g011 [Gracilaria domingensis]|nr:hypothetical protein FGB62_2g011 [Gracilaria domingensis]